MKDRDELFEHYILFIQWEARLDDDYIRLASEFREYSVTLVPVKPQELDHFLDSRPVPVVALTKTISQFKHYQYYRKRCFDFLLKRQKINLFHLNSFSETRDYLSLKQRGIYNPLPLPLKFSEVAKRVLAGYLKDVSSDTRWPGGKRAKLPQMSGD